MIINAIQLGGRLQTFSGFLSEKQSAFSIQVMFVRINVTCALYKRHVLIEVS